MLPLLATDHLFVPSVGPIYAGVSADYAKQLGFEIVKEEFVAEYNALATLYRHSHTGAEIMSLQCEDENKVFGVTLRTPV